MSNKFQMSNIKYQISNKISKCREYFRIGNSRRGFTLIELLIVVAIIGVLAGLLMVNFVGIRQRARDAQRKADLRQIQIALETYRSDQGTYPITIPNCPSGAPTALMSLDCVTSTYMKNLPKDILGSTYYDSANSGRYFYTSDGTIYNIAACLENTNDASAETTINSPGGSGCTSGKYYVLTNP